MKKIIPLLIILLSVLVVIHCKNIEKETFGNTKNPLYGMPFQNIKNVPQLKNYPYFKDSIHIGSFDNNNSKDSNNLVWLELEDDVQHNYSEDGHIFLSTLQKETIILTKCIYKPDSPIAQYRILDTMLSTQTIFTPSTIDSISDPTIVIYGSGYSKLNIIKAWITDKKTGKIIPLENKKIYCVFRNMTMTTVVNVYQT